MPFTLPPLLADMTIPGHQFGIRSETAPGSEAFVVLTLGFLTFLFIGFAVGGYVLWLRERHPKPHCQLLMELEAEADEDETSSPAPPPVSQDRKPAKPKPKAWERDGDWWKE